MMNSKDIKKLLKSFVVFILMLFVMLSNNNITNAEDSKKEISRDEYSITFQTSKGYVTEYSSMPISIRDSNGRWIKNNNTFTKENGIDNLYGFYDVNNDGEKITIVSANNQKLYIDAENVSSDEKTINSDSINIIFSDYFAKAKVKSTLEIDASNYNIFETDNSILLKKNGCTEFELEKSKIKVENNKIILLPNAEFKIIVNVVKVSKARAINTGVPNVHQNVIKSYNPDGSDYDGDTWMNIGGYENRETGRKIGYVRSLMIFDMPTINKDYGDIVSAKLQMHIVHNENNRKQNVSKYTLRSKGYSNIQYVTWNNQPNLSKNYGNPTFSNTGSYDLGSHEYNILSYIKGMNSGTSSRETFGFYGPEDSTYDGLAYSTTASKIIITQEGDYCPSDRPLPNNLKWSCKVSDIYENEELAEVIADKLNVDVNTSINKAKLDTINDLEISNLNNNDLSDLDNTTFSNLEILKLNHLKLRDLDISNWEMPKLTTLDIQYNEFDMLPSVPSTVSNFIHINQLRQYPLVQKDGSANDIVLTMPKIYSELTSTKILDVYMNGVKVSASSYKVNDASLTIYRNGVETKDVTFKINNGYANDGYEYKYLVGLKESTINPSTKSKVAIQKDKCTKDQEIFVYQPNTKYIKYRYIKTCKGAVPLITVYLKNTTKENRNNRIYYEVRRNTVSYITNVKNKKISRSNRTVVSVTLYDKNKSTNASTVYRLGTTNLLAKSAPKNFFNAKAKDNRIKDMKLNNPDKNIKDYTAFLKCDITLSTPSVYSKGKKMIDQQESIGKFLQGCKNERYQLTNKKKIKEIAVFSVRNYKSNKYFYLSGGKQLISGYNSKYTKGKTFSYGKSLSNYYLPIKSGKISGWGTATQGAVGGIKTKKELRHTYARRLTNTHLQRTSNSWYYPKSYGGGWHPGIDVQESVGKTPNVYAQFEGVVVKKVTSNSGYGCYLDISYRINDEESIRVRYGHFKRNTYPKAIKKGAFVKPTSKLANMGTTGNSSGMHVHNEYEVLIGDFNKAKKYTSDTFGYSSKTMNNDKNGIYRMYSYHMFKKMKGKKIKIIS